jgi:PPIC-type PPIASE domain
MIFRRGRRRARRGWRARRLAALGTLGALAFGAAGCGSTLSDAATISYRDGNGEQTAHISQDALLDRVEASIDSKAFRDLAQTAGFKPGDGESTDASLTAYWLSQLINEAVIDAEYKGQRLQTTDADRSGAQQAIEQRFGPDVFNAWPESFRDELLTEQAKLAAVLRSCPSGRVVSHILLRTRAAAEAAYEQIRGGQQFESVARAKSIDSSGQQGGLLGCLGPNLFPPAFQAVADTARLDVVTPPVQTNVGYHLILVREWDPKLADNPQMAQGAAQAASATLAARLRDLDVRVDPRYGTWGAHDTADGRQAYNVAAPSVPAPRDKREP